MLVACEFDPSAFPTGDNADSAGLGQPDSADASSAPPPDADGATAPADAAPPPPDAAVTCSESCSALQACVGGSCQCAPEMFVCPGFGESCDDILSDPNHCGTTCAEAENQQCRSDQICSAGACICRPGLTPALGVCVDTTSAPFACGPEGGPVANCGEDRCQDGVCVEDCSQGRRNCGGENPGGTCIDPRTNPRNCGECGRSCDTGELCVAGECQRYEPTGPCNSCPCPRCDELFTDNGSCCDYGPEPVCLQGPSCP